MKRLLPMLLLLITPAVLAAPKTSPCSLDRSILAAYDNPKTKIEELSPVRWKLSRFTGCDPRDLDPETRKVFFELVEREFQFDFKEQLAAWSRQYPDSEALYDGLLMHQGELRVYLDRVFDPKLDKKYDKVVLKYGLGRTIARLGPEARNDVKAILRGIRQSYGIAKYNPQVEALDTLGYWLDPSNVLFTPVEKSEFVGILTGVLDVVENVPPGDLNALVHATLTALARSDDPWAEARIRRWMTKQDTRAELYRKASSSADEIQKKIKARKPKT